MTRNLIHRLYRRIVLLRRRKGVEKSFNLLKKEEDSIIPLRIYFKLLITL